MYFKKKDGFTLVELLVVIAILAILATVSVVGYTSFIQKATISTDESAITQLNKYVTLYKIEHNGIITEEDVNAILIQSGMSDIKPNSEKYGYDFYFNFEKEKFELLKSEDALGNDNLVKIPDGLEGYVQPEEVIPSVPDVPTTPDDNDEPEIDTPNPNPNPDGGDDNEGGDNTGSGDDNEGEDNTGGGDDSGTNKPDSEPEPQLALNLEYQNRGTSTLGAYLENGILVIVNNTNFTFDNNMANYYTTDISDLIIGIDENDVKYIITSDIITQSDVETYRKPVINTVSKKIILYNSGEYTLSITSRGQTIDIPVKVINSQYDDAEISIAAHPNSSNIDNTVRIPIDLLFSISDYFTYDSADFQYYNINLRDTENDFIEKLINSGRIKFTYNNNPLEIIDGNISINNITPTKDMTIQFVTSYMGHNGKWVNITIQMKFKTVSTKSNTNNYTIVN